MGVRTSRRARQARAKAAPQAAASPAVNQNTANRSVFGRRDKWIFATALLLCQATAATWGQFDFGNMMGYYGMFADGLVNGHLHIPYKPDQVNLVDMIPYEGRYYLQWGPFPVVFHLLLKPFGIALSDRVVCVAAGWLTALVFLEAVLLLRRRFFAGMPVSLAVWFTLAFALGTPAALVTYRGTVYNESIGIALLCVLAAFHALLRYQEDRRTRWFAIAGALIGAATATRVTMGLYGGVFFAVLAAALWFERAKPAVIVRKLAAFSLPVALGVVLMLGYNYARFGNPFDYGNSYKPGETSHYAAFSLARIPENLRHYLLSVPKPGADFPWLAHEGWQPLRHTSRAEAMSSLVIGSPFLLLGAVAWRVFRRGSPAPADLKWASAAAGAGALAMFGVLLLFAAASRRYAHDFVPFLMTLAVIGAGMLASPAETWKRWKPLAVAVLALSALLHAQIAFYQSFHTPTPDVNVIRTFTALSPLLPESLRGPRARQEEAMARNDLGTAYMREGRLTQALSQFEKAAELMPDSELIRNNLQMARRMAGR